ncbi:MAG: cytochrome b/b6 domain-containing protein [Asticcacaulis sp.]
MDQDKTSIHPLWLRLIHWCNAAAVIVLIMSGWRIYNANRFMHLYVPFTNERLFPAKWTLGGWLGGAIQWHFAAIWILFASAILYAILFILSRRGRQFWPVTLKGLWSDIKATLTGHLSHADIRQYNMIQKLAYLFAMADLVVLIASGLVLWKSVQFGWLRVLMGGYEMARHVHFYAMAALVAFIFVHVVMAFLVPKTIKAMLWGR